MSMALLFVAVVMYAASSAKKTRDRQAAAPLGQSQLMQQQRFGSSRTEEIGRQEIGREIGREVGRRSELEIVRPPRAKPGETVRNQWGDEISAGHKDES